MAYDTTILFRDDSYLKEIEATVLAINERGGILTDQTIFYATSGGQPGDTGVFVRADGSTIAIAATVTGESKEEIIHVPAPEQPVPAIGEKLVLRIDWDRRYKLMRMHAACHLLSVVCPFPITGASVAEDDSRVDFDLPDAGWIEFSTGAASGNLSLTLAEEGWQPGFGTTIVLNVADCRVAVEVLRSRGVRCDDAQDFPGFVTFASFYDPFGNRLQMCSPAP